MNNKRIVNKELFFLLVPLILENIFSSSASIVTTAMVGRLMSVDIAAQGICSRLTNTLWVFYKGIAMGLTILTALYYGEGDKKKCRKVFEQGFITILSLSIIFLFLVSSFPYTFLGFFTKDQEILQLAEKFLQITVCGFPFVAITVIVPAVFQGHGNTKTPLYIAIIINIVNIIVGYLLIFGAFGFPKMGIIGAAIALVTSQIAGALIGIYLLLFSKKSVLEKTKFSLKSLVPNLSYLRKIFAIGIPVAFENLFWQLSSIIMSKVILTYGRDFYAAYNLGLQAEAITEMPAFGFAVASTTLSAKAIGKKDDDLFKLYFKQLVKIASIMSTVTSLILLVFPGFLLDLLTNSANLKSIGIWYVFLMGFAQIPQNLSRVYSGTIRAAGHKNVPMYITAVGIWLIRIPLSLLAAYVLKVDILYIWLTIVFDQAVRFSISYFYFKNKDIINTVSKLPSYKESIVI